MRRLSFFLLLMTAAAPALAAPGDEGDRGGRHQRGEASEPSESRPQRVRNEPSPQSGERQVGAQRSDRAGPAQQGTAESIRERLQQHRLERKQQAASTQSDSDNSTAAPRRRERDSASDSPSTLRPRERQVRTIPDTQPSVTTQNRGEVAGTFGGRPHRDYRDGNYTRWSTTHWRHDHRYDWRRWRDRHRSLFRLGFYYDPFGWSYRRWALGSFLWPSYYGSRYWLNDPWHYRLPPAYGPYRWVRYWDDALLVNIYTGEVVDVIHNFFW